MNISTVHAVLFDFGGVLAEEGFRDGLIALANEQELNVEDMPKEGMMAVYDSGFVLGRGTAAEFWALLRQRTGLTGDDETLTKRILDGFVVRPMMIELVRDLRTHGYVTGILSDQTHWLDELDDRYHFSQSFDQIYNSYYLGKGKRDNSLFADVAMDLGFSPSTLLFVDDDSGNVVRAKEAGYQAIRFIGQETFITELHKLLLEK